MLLVKDQDLHLLALLHCLRDQDCLPSQHMLFKLDRRLQDHAHCPKQHQCPAHPYTWAQAGLHPSSTHLVDREDLDRWVRAEEEEAERC